MKKMMKKMARIAAIIAILSLGNACSGDDNNEPDPEVRIEQNLDPSFLNDNWQYESITADTPEDYNRDGNKSTDILSQYPEDKKDDILGFIPNGLRYDIREKGVKTAPFIEQGTYTIERDQITMINSENALRTTFKKVKALQDNNGHGKRFLQYRDKNNYLVVRRAIDIL